MDNEIKEFAIRVGKIKNDLYTEEATKTALIMPFFNMLGYDVFNPTEFIPEFIADIGIKKGEKVDYAIKINGEVVILIEAKSVGTDLSRVDGQLARYFHVVDAKVAILTDGVTYKFFSDIEKTNVMDINPFFEIDMSNLDQQKIQDIQNFSKNNFQIDKILGLATNLKYVSLIKNKITSLMDNPNDEFIKLILADVYEGPKTKQIIEHFEPLIKKSFNQLIIEKVETKLSNAIYGIKEDDDVIEPIEPKIVTTQDEIQFYQIIKSLLIGTIELHRITYRDAESYFNVLLDDNGRKWICRAKFLKDMSINVTFRDETINIPNLDYLYELKDKFVTAVLYYN